MRRSLPHYRHRAGIDTLCFTVPDTRGSTPPACLYRYANVYYKGNMQVIKGNRWRAHTTRGGYLYVRIDSPHPAVPMNQKVLSSRVATILALLGVPWRTWSASRVKRVDIAYDSGLEHLPDELTHEQKKRKMKMWEYNGKKSKTLYIGNKNRVTAYYPKHTELSERYRILLPCPSFRREERYMNNAVKKASLHTIGRVMAHAKRASDRHRRLYNNVKHLLVPCYRLIPAHAAAYIIPAVLIPCPYRGRAPPLFPHPHTPNISSSSTVAPPSCCCSMEGEGGMRPCFKRKSLALAFKASAFHLVPALPAPRAAVEQGAYIQKKHPLNMGAYIPLPFCTSSCQNRLWLLYYAQLRYSSTSARH